MTPEHPHLMVVLANATSPEVAEDFSRWYSETHVPEVLANLDALACARRYQLSAEQMPGAAPGFRFLALYGIEAGRVAEARDAIIGQREERAEALAAGRKPKVSIVPELAPDITVTFYDAVT
ncbi:hypothetical protein GIS00_05675 [Nakamurella sp. YIM 132087]|uniref:EthD family reductase n=1 Tax=Nakamurella alba TaxID=2665158 RepID=A0A7K1FJK0_9ACTN|nr:DUF4286 family protein [Nakamurella alba]MTD13433.1 hypothetical protein [Nakamurella alba]